MWTIRLLIWDCCCISYTCRIFSYPHCHYYYSPPSPSYSLTACVELVATNILHRICILCYKLIRLKSLLEPLCRNEYENSDKSSCVRASKSETLKMSGFLLSPRCVGLSRSARLYFQAKHLQHKNSIFSRNLFVWCPVLQRLPWILNDAIQACCRCWFQRVQYNGFKTVHRKVQVTKHEKKQEKNTKNCSEFICFEFILSALSSDHSQRTKLTYVHSHVRFQKWICVHSYARTNFRFVVNKSRNEQKWTFLLLTVIFVYAAKVKRP